jgi:hypothetical protein
MAKITTFLYASNVIQDNNAKTPIFNVITPLQVIVSAFIPTTYSFSVVFGIRDFDILMNHNIKLEFCSPEDNKVLIDLIFDVPQFPEISNLPDDYKGFIATANFQNVLINQKGVYNTNIFFDGEILGSYEIYITKANENE